MKKKYLVLVVGMAPFAWAQSMPQSQPHRAVCLGLPIVEASGQQIAGLPQRIRIQLAALLNASAVQVVEPSPACDFHLEVKVVRTAGDGSKGFGGLPTIDKAAGDLSSVASSLGGKVPPTVQTAANIGATALKWLKKPKPIEMTAEVKLTTKDGRNLLDESEKVKSASDESLVVVVLQNAASRVITVLAQEK